MPKHLRLLPATLVENNARQSCAQIDWLKQGGQEQPGHKLLASFFIKLITITSDDAG